MREKRKKRGKNSKENSGKRPKEGSEQGTFLTQPKESRSSKVNTQRSRQKNVSIGQTPAGSVMPPSKSTSPLNSQITLNKASELESLDDNQNQTTFGSSTFISIKHKHDHTRDKESITSHGFNKLKALDEAITDGDKTNLYLGPKAIY